MGREVPRRVKDLHVDLETPSTSSLRNGHSATPDEIAEHIGVPARVLEASAAGAPTEVAARERQRRRRRPTEQRPAHRRPAAGGSDDRLIVPAAARLAAERERTIVELRFYPIESERDRAQVGVSQVNVSA